MRAEEIQEVLPGLYFWQAYSPEVKTELSSVAIRTGAGLVLVDPIPLAPAAMEELMGFGQPASIVLTNGNHERASAFFKQKFGVPIIAHEAAQEDFKADQIVREGEKIHGELEVVELAGFGSGEIALFSPTGPGVVMVGDALINVGSHGFAPLPDKYRSDAKIGRGPLEKLLKFSFKVMTFAHGLPIASAGRERLQNILS